MKIINDIYFKIGFSRLLNVTDLHIRALLSLCSNNAITTDAGHEALIKNMEKIDRLQEKMACKDITIKLEEIPSFIE